MKRAAAAFLAAGLLVSQLPATALAEAEEALSAASDILGGSDNEEGGETAPVEESAPAEETAPAAEEAAEAETAADDGQGEDITETPSAESAAESLTGENGQPAEQGELGSGEEQENGAAPETSGEEADPEKPSAGEEQAPQSFAVYYFAGEGGSVSVKEERIPSEDGSYAGAEAHADEGYDFLRWMNEEGETVSGNAKLSLADVLSKETLTAPERDYAFTAEFEEELPEVKEELSSQSFTVCYVAGEGGSVSVEEERIPSEDGSYAGAEAHADEGYDFLRWTNEEGETVSENAKLSLTDVLSKETLAAPEKDHVFTAKFEEWPAIRFADAEFADGSYVSVSAPAGAFPRGTELTVTQADVKELLPRIQEWNEQEWKEGETLGEENVAVYNFDFHTGSESHIEPRKPVSVRFCRLAIEGDEELRICHMEDAGAELQELEPVSVCAPETGGKDGAPGGAQETEAEIRTRDFSYYVLMRGPLRTPMNPADVNVYIRSPYGDSGASVLTGTPVQYDIIHSVNSGDANESYYLEVRIPKEHIRPKADGLSYFNYGEAVGQTSMQFQETMTEYLLFYFFPPAEAGALISVPIKLTSRSYDTPNHTSYTVTAHIKTAGGAVLQTATYETEFTTNNYFINAGYNDADLAKCYQPIGTTLVHEYTVGGPELNAGGTALSAEPPEISLQPYLEDKVMLYQIGDRSIGKIRVVYELPEGAQFKGTTGETVTAEGKETWSYDPVTRRAECLAEYDLAPDSTGKRIGISQSYVPRVKFNIPNGQLGNTYHLTYQVTELHPFRPSAQETPYTVEPVDVPLLFRAKQPAPGTWQVTYYQQCRKETGGTGNNARDTREGREKEYSYSISMQSVFFSNYAAPDNYYMENWRMDDLGMDPRLKYTKLELFAPNEDNKGRPFATGWIRVIGHKAGGQEVELLRYKPRGGYSYEFTSVPVNDDGITGFSVVPEDSSVKLDPSAFFWINAYVRLRDPETPVVPDGHIEERLENSVSCSFGQPVGSVYLHDKTEEKDRKAYLRFRHDELKMENYVEVTPNGQLFLGNEYTLCGRAALRSGGGKRHDHTALELVLPKGVQYIPGSASLSGASPDTEYSAEEALAHHMTVEPQADGRTKIRVSFGALDLTGKEWDASYSFPALSVRGRIGEETRPGSNLNYCNAEVGVYSGSRSRSVVYVPSNTLFIYKTTYAETEKSVVMPGQQASYRLHVQNYTSNAVHDLVLVDILPGPGDMTVSAPHTARGSEFRLRQIHASPKFRWSGGIDEIFTLYYTRTVPTEGNIESFVSTAEWIEQNGSAAALPEDATAVKWVLKPGESIQPNSEGELWLYGDTYVREEDFRYGMKAFNSFAASFNGDSFFESNTVEVELKRSLVRGRMFLDLDHSESCTPADRLLENEYLQLFREDGSYLDGNFTLQNGEFEMETSYMGRCYVKAPSMTNMVFLPYREGESDILDGGNTSAVFTLSDDHYEQTIHVGYKPVGSSYLLAYDANGGEFRDSFDIRKRYGCVPYLFGESFTIQSTRYKPPEQYRHSFDFWRAGWMFTGWNTQPDGGGTSYEPGQEVSDIASAPDETVVLYAQWEPGKYRIEFDKNIGGATGVMAPELLSYDESRSLPSCSFHYDEGEFVAWNTRPDGSGTWYGNGAEVSHLWSGQYCGGGYTHPMNNGVPYVTLYAIWTLDVYTSKGNFSGYSNDMFSADGMQLKPGVAQDYDYFPSDYMPKRPLAGAVFELNRYNDDGSMGELIQTVTSQTDGTMFLHGVMPGKYYLTETQMPNGCASVDGSYIITIGTPEGRPAITEAVKTKPGMPDPYRFFFHMKGASCMFDNYEDVDLLVSKELPDVGSEFAGADPYFTFSLTITGQGGTPVANRTIAYKGEILTGSGAEAPPDGSITTDGSGRAQFRLKKGQLLRFRDVPLLADITIKEENTHTALHVETQIDGGGYTVNTERSVTVTPQTDGQDIRVDFRNSNYIPVPAGVEETNDWPLRTASGTAVLLFGLCTLHGALARRHRRAGR